MNNIYKISKISKIFSRLDFNKKILFLEQFGKDNKDNKNNKKDQNTSDDDDDNTMEDPTMGGLFSLDPRKDPRFKAAPISAEVLGITQKIAQRYSIENNPLKTKKRNIISLSNGGFNNFNNRIQS